MIDKKEIIFETKTYVCTWDEVIFKEKKSKFRLFDILRDNSPFPSPFKNLKDTLVQNDLHRHDVLLRVRELSVKKAGKKVRKLLSLDEIFNIIEAVEKEFPNFERDKEMLAKAFKKVIKGRIK